MNIVAPTNCYLGYGHVGWNILYHSYLQGHNPTFFPIGNPNITYGTEAADCLNSTHYVAKDGGSSSAPTLVIWHEFGLLEKALGRGEKIGLSFFELSRLDRVRKINLNGMDINIQASHWGKEVLENNGIKTRIEVLPCGFNPDTFYPRPNTEDTYKFFNIGKMEYRKGHDAIIDAFYRTFNKNDDVELHMVWENGFLNEQKKKEWVDLYKKSPLGDKIFFHGHFNSDLDLGDFIRSMDCGLFPTRSEGFGLPILQSIACGKPIITTDYSAHTEFSNPQNSFLLNIDSFEPSVDNVFFISGRIPYGSMWAKLTDNNLDQMSNYMMYCYEERYREDRSGTVKDLTWDKIVCRLHQLF